MKRRRAATTLLFAGLIAVAAATLTPLVWMVSASLMPTGEASSIPPRLVPSTVTFAHYRDLFTRLDVGRNALNSLVLATAVTIASVLLNSLAGYAFAKLRFTGRAQLFRTLMAALVIPTQVAMLPLFLLLRAVGLVNTYWGVILPSIASIFGIFLVRQYAQSIPDELIEAARIDSAGELTIFRRLILPLCRPILVTLVVFTFLAIWNDFLWPLIVLTDQSMYTFLVALANLEGEYHQDIELMMSGAVLTMTPVLLLFLALQRYYLEGIMLGSTKG